MNCPRQYCVAAQIGKISQKMQSIAMLLKLFFIGFLLVCVNDIARQFDECYLKNSSNSTTKYIHSWGGVIYGEVKKYTYFMIKTYSNIGECNYVIVWSCGLYDAVNVSDCVDSAVSAQPDSVGVTALIFQLLLHYRLLVNFGQDIKIL